MPTTSTWSGSPSIRGPTESVQLALLTVVLIGMVCTWGVEMTYCTPYLLQLGLSKSKISLVWVAGPASGLVVQPIVGAIADRSTSKYGRRRPFMLGASIVVGLALLMLGWTSEVVGLFISTESTRQTLTIVVAVVCIWIVDFSINAVQACSRALIVDTLPISKQSLGAAWDVRMGAAGHVLVSLVGRLDLVNIFPDWFGGDSQFKKMTVFAAISLWTAVSVTAYAVTERVLIAPGDDGVKNGNGPKTGLASAKATILTIFHRILHLPTRIQAICWVQFWSWIGWFPFLFYSSTWVGETYYRYEHRAEVGNDKQSNDDALGNIGRLGSTALGIFSVVVLVASVVLPRLVRPSRTSSPQHRFSRAGEPKPQRGSDFLQAVRNVLSKAASHRPGVITTWIISELLFASIMMWAPLVRSVALATVLVSLAGVPWAVSIWAPFAEIGVEINRLASDGTSNGNADVLVGHGGYTAVRPSVEEDEAEQMEMEDARPERNSSRHRRRSSSGVLRLHHPDDDDPEAVSSTGELAGIYLGVLNVYTTLPQFVGTAISWVVFSVLEPGRNKTAGEAEGDDGADGQSQNNWLDLAKDGRPNAIAVCLFIGALCAIVAAEAARRLRKLS